MKSGLQATRDVRTLIDIPEIRENISGGIYSQTLLKIDTESIVVSCFTMSNQFIQNGTVNVNIHCPMKSMNLVGFQAQQVPDLDNFNRIADLILPHLDCQWKYDFNTEVESPGILIRDADGSYFMNIRLKYRSLQSNYKNI